MAVEQIVPFAQPTGRDLGGDTAAIEEADPVRDAADHAEVLLRDQHRPVKVVGTDALPGTVVLLE